MELLYVPYNLINIIHYAARTCYRSHEHRSKTGEELLSALIKSGHESVVEHGHIVMRFNKKDYSASTILKFMHDTENDGNPHKILANMVETSKYRYLSMNIRSMRTAIKYNKENALTVGIIENIIPKLPSILFKDILLDLPDNFTDKSEYFLFDRDDRYAFLTDILDLDKIMASMLEDDNELTIKALSGLVTITFRLILPRWASTQLNRHRCFNISAESLRYVKRSKMDIEYYRSPKLMGKKILISSDVLNLNANGALMELSYPDIIKFSHMCANRFAEQKVPDEELRNMLPLATMTETVYTAHLNELNNVFKLRLNKVTQLDTRVMMYHIYHYLKFMGFITVSKTIDDFDKLIDEYRGDIYDVVRR